MNSIAALLGVAWVLSGQAAAAQSLRRPVFYPLANGAFPNGNLASIGPAVYGTVMYGGSNGFGAVYALTPSTGTLQLIYNFTGGADGAYPAGVTAAGGLLFGNANGTVFQLDPVAGTFRTIATVAEAYEGGPFAMLYLHGELWGASALGGTFGRGTIFKVDIASGTVTNVYSFGTDTPALGPTPGLTYVGGKLYGTTQGVGGTNNSGALYSYDIKSRVMTTLHQFGLADAGYPSTGSLIYAGNRLFGTTSGGSGGADGGACNNYCGGVYAYNIATGQQSVLYRFQGGYGDGADPYGTLAYADGMIYGTTLFGGGNWCFDYGVGCGTIFQLNPKNNQETMLYTPTDGPVSPLGGMLFVNGLLYGSFSGLINTCAIYGGECSAVFKLDPSLYRNPHGAALTLPRAPGSAPG